ncbi:MAG TPA: DegT/DnrJ/EryC1/StrS family aminotransferase [Opitutaceae bacterium]|nr:DegT/DnrJ/EryC1/StrS family aminotransferase [Opitutaceae bacterium]
MNVPIQDLTRHNQPIAGALAEACREVIESGWYVLGRQVASFEAEFARFLQIEHCVTVANGTDALELAMRAVGVERGDEVILAANAGMYSTVAALAIGATPIYAEIDEQRLSLSFTAIERAFSSSTKAVVLTHLYGCSGYVEEIAQLCRSAEIPLIEDCAESHGARVAGKAVGGWGDVGCFSFYPTKNLGALGDGGACTTHRSDIAAQLRHLRQYGWEARYRAVTAGGRNSRLDEIQAAILRRKLPHLNEWNARRRAIALRYNEAFSKLPIKCPWIDGDAYVGHLYVARVPNRDAFREALKSRGVATDVHFPLPDYRQPAIASQLGKRWELSLTEEACATVVTLPCFPEMEDKEIEYVISAVRDAVTQTRTRAR